MSHDIESQEMQKLLREAYDAPPPEPEFVKELGEKLTREMNATQAKAAPPQKRVTDRRRRRLLVPAAAALLLVVAGEWLLQRWNSANDLMDLTLRSTSAADRKPPSTNGPASYPPNPLAFEQVDAAYNLATIRDGTSNTIGYAERRQTAKSRRGPWSEIYSSKLSAADTNFPAPKAFGQSGAGGIVAGPTTAPYAASQSRPLLGISPHKKLADTWGKLPPAEQKKAIADLTKNLPPEQRQAVEKQFQALGENHSGNLYDRVVENPFRLAQVAPLSTFSIDVDTASYSNVRRFLQQNEMPPRDAVRVEELINYFEYEYPPPNGDHPVAIHADVCMCPWNPQHQLVRIGLKATAVDPMHPPARNFVFLIDCSGSMGPSDRLPLLKESLRLLVKQLTAKDRVAIVAYAGSAGLVLPPTRGDQQEAILAAIARVDSGGSTNGAQGIQLAYQLAEESLVKGAVNRVILGTDGDFNVGITSQADLVRLIEEKRKTGIYLSILGFGMGNLKDATMEKLAHHGNGHYAYIDSLEEAERLFVGNAGVLTTVANDVKLQVEFNPAWVQAYRLVGYANRLMRDEDFNDDTKDAGDLGAGQTVTAFYEIVPPGVQIELPGVEKLKYQKPRDPAAAADSAELLTVKLRYTPPEEKKSRLLEVPLPNRKHDFKQMPDDFRFAAAVAAFGMLLSGSEYKGDATLAKVLDWAGDARGQDPAGRRGEFIQLVQTAARLSR